MINLNIPELMEDELLYSFIIRMAEENVMEGKDFVRIYIANLAPEKRKEIQMSPFLITSTVYVLNIASILEVDPLDFLLKTTIYPGIAPLISTEKQGRIINISCRENSYKYPKLIRIPKSEISRMKYCPLCRQEDIQNQGFTWLRRAHHMPGVTTCWKHGVKLCEPAIQNNYSEQIVFPDAQPIPSNETEISYARFSKEFLEAKPDLNEFLTIQIIKKTAKIYSPDKMLREVARILHIESEAYLQHIFDRGKMIAPAKLLTALFVLFQKVSDIPKFEDEYTKNKFAACSSEYDLLSDYSGIVVKMRKHGEANSFITTPYGFISGWRSLSEDPTDEQEKFIQIVNCLRNNEYKPLDPFISYEKPIRFFHENCGRITETLPRKFLSYDTSCQCRLDYVNNIRYPKKLVEKIGNYELLYFGQDLDLSIYAADCGHFFRTDINSWCGNPGCRVCNIIETSCDNDEQNSKSVGFLPTDIFRREVKDLIGDEYEVVSDFINMNTPVNIRHRCCGKVKSYLPSKFLHGARCECDKKEWIPSGMAFCDYVYSRSLGKYEASIQSDDKRKYLVRNTITGEVHSLTKQYIIQELERPTKSDILPLDEKGKFQPKTNVGKVREYILNNYKQDDEFNIGSIQIPDLDKHQIHSAVNKLASKHFIEKIPYHEGLYLFTKGLTTLPEGKYDDKAYGFKKKIHELVGNEYEVIGEYVDSKTPIELRHNKCKQTFMVKPEYFVHGVRCSCEHGKMNREEFLKFVHDHSDGLYEVQPIGYGEYYEIKNTKTGWTKKMTKMFILQEMRRPTPSTVLE